MRPRWLVALAGCAAATTAHAEPAAPAEPHEPPEPASLTLAPGEADSLRARLAGHAVRVADDGATLWIDDAAGEGPPRVGVIVRDGDDLVLATAAGRWRLQGPLARPRIAGPGYTVWVIGDIMPTERGALRIRRLGVLRRPR